MGRRKIEIKFINDDRNRSVTFIKRKNGLFKKAHELSILTGAKVTVHVEDIKERQFDYVSENLGGEDALLHFQSDDDDDDSHSFDGHEDVQDMDHLETESLGGSTTTSKRDSAILRPAHRRSQSSLHLSPNPNVSASRRSSGHPYPRSPNAGPQSSAGLARPASMDFGTNNYPVNTAAGGPQRKFSGSSTNGPYPSQHQVPSQQYPSQQAQFYFHPNQSHPGFTAYDQYSQQQMPRYNGNLFQTNGYLATNSQQHVPAYPSNLVPNVSRHSGHTLPASKEDPYEEFGGSLADLMDDDPEHDYMGTQASTPGNYDFSTNPSLTNLNIGMSAGMHQLQQHQQPQPQSQQVQSQQVQSQQVQSQQVQPQQVQQQRVQPLGLGLQNAAFMGLANPNAIHYAQPQPQHYQDVQAAQRGFYNNPSGAQSTPNLQWTLDHHSQISPARR